MPRETQVGLTKTNIGPATSATPGVQVTASQAVQAPVDKLARLGVSLQRGLAPLENRVEFETREAEEEHRLKQDFEGKLYGVEIQTRAMRNMDAWKNSPNGIEEAKAWHMEAINGIADEQQKRAAAGYIMAAYQNVATSLQAHYKEQETLKLEAGGQQLLAAQAESGALFSLNGATDSIEYLSKLLGDRRKAGQMVVKAMIDYAEANPDRDAEKLSSEIFSNIKIDDVPLEHIYKDDLTNARDRVTQRWKRENAEAIDAQNYEITKKLQDQLVNGTLSDRVLNGIAKQYPDYSKDKLLSFRSQMLADRKERAELNDSYVSFRNGDYTASYLSEKTARKNMELYAQEVAQRKNEDGTPYTPEQFERAIIEKSRDMGTGYLYEPWKQTLEHAEPGGSRYAEAASMFQRIYAMDPSYAESLVSDAKAAQYHAYNHLMSQNVPMEQAVEMVRTGATPDSLKEARTRMDFREDGEFRKTVKNVGGANERYAHEVVRKTMETYMSMGMPESQAAELAENRFRAVHTKFGDSWVYTAGQTMPAGFEDAANDALKNTIPQALEAAGLATDPNGYTIGLVPASMGLVKSEDGKTLDRVVAVLDSSFRPVMVNGEPVRIRMHELAADYGKRKVIEAQRRKQAERENPLYSDIPLSP